MPCFLLGCAIVLSATSGCATSDRSHAKLGLTEIAPPAVARANEAMAITGHLVDGKPLSVLSYNMQREQGHDDVQFVARHLKDEVTRLPDFILCQEVMFNRSSRAEFRSTADMLARELGYYSDGSQRRSGREGIAIVSRYPFAFFEAKQLENSSLLGFPRVSVMGEFLVPGTGRVRVVDVHLTHWGGEHTMRHKQLEETLLWVAQREREVHADVMILGGDFNARPDWRELNIVNDAPPEVDFDLMNFNTDEPTKGGHGRWNYRVDYIFAAAPQRDLRFHGETLLWPDGLPKESGHGRFWASDHLLLLHEYAVGTPASVVSANQKMSVAAAATD